MEENLFEGSLLLEKLAELDLVDDFFEAVDSDDPRKVVKILRNAAVDDDTIAIVLEKMEAADGKH